MGCPQAHAPCLKGGNAGFQRVVLEGGLGYGSSASFERAAVMAKIVKGAKRYVLVRGKDENGDYIVIDMFNKKEFDRSCKEGRIQQSDHVVKVEVLGNVDLKKQKKPKRG